MAPPETATPIDSQSEILRPLAIFPKDIWGDRFTSYALDNQVYYRYPGEIEILKEEVRSMITATGKTMTEKLTLMDSVERLGISYYFVREIEEQLGEIFTLPSNFEQYPDSYDLSIAALQFRLFRQHGLNISCDIFYRFTDANGKFSASLNKDVRGLLSLYQAAQVRTHGDNILEEALAFTTYHLKSELQHANSTIAKEVKYALQQALHKDIPRVAARHYISIYEEDESNNKLLLRLAKLDYNMLQMLHKQELCQLMRWGKDLEIESKLGHSRGGRVVESYFFAVSVFVEPQDSLCRMILAKTTVLLTVVDDTYDSYGTLDELKTFTDALERWDAREIDQLPNYMKNSYMALLRLTDEIEKDLAGLGRSYAIDKYKEEWKQYARTSYIQSNWFFTRELPPFPEYLSNGLITGLGYILLPTALQAMNCGTKEVFDWLSKDPKVLVAYSKLCRLPNDIGSYKREKLNGATAIECYMKHYNVCEQEAMNRFEEICEDAWKDINEAFLRPTAVSREALMPCLSISRAVDVFYKDREDGFTDPRKVIEPYIFALLVDPITV